MELNARICFLNRHNTHRHQFKLHSHTCYEAVYFLSGSGKATIGGKSYSVSPHSFCIIPPRTEHVETIDGYGEILFIGFDYDSRQYPLQAGVYHHGEIARLSLFNAIFDEYKKQEFGFREAAGHLLMLFLFGVLRSGQSEDNKRKDLRHIKEYIRQHAGQKINFRELSLLSGYSYDYFRHLFKQRFGATPQEYLIDVRMEKAKALLENTQLSCTEIAYNCGFSNSAQMASMFRARYGKAPTSFRIADLYKTSQKS